MMESIIAYVEAHWGVFLTLSGIVLSVIYAKLDSRYARKIEVKEDIAKVDEKYVHIEHRVDTIEQAIINLPSAKNLADMRLETADMRGEIKELNATLKGVKHIGNLILENSIKDKQ